MWITSVFHVKPLTLYKPLIFKAFEKTHEFIHVKPLTLTREIANGGT